MVSKINKQKPNEDLTDIIVYLPPDLCAPIVLFI